MTEPRDESVVMQSFGATLKVKDFAIHRMGKKGRRTLVRISGEVDAHRGRRLGIDYMPCGGGSFWWDEADFEPVTRPLDKAMCKLVLARDRLAAAQAEVTRATAEIAKWEGVVECLRDGGNDDVS